MKNGDSDDALIAEHLLGDENAFSLIVKQNLKTVYNFTRRLAGNDADAEDAAQETFVKAWKNLKKYRKGENFRAWLLRIARNTSIDLLRKKRDVSFSSFEDAGESPFAETIADSGPLLTDIAEKKDDVRHLGEILEKLRPMYREILVLHYQEHLTFREIGDVLEKSTDTVKSQHRRAIQALRSLYAPKDAPHA
jgi:RNA polymerase sigma-70 factor, ECF subfamily